MTSTKQAQAQSKRSKSRIPDFKTIEEAAEFWDTHDSTEFEDEFEDVTGEVHFIVTRTPEKKAITVRMPADLAAEMASLARARGVATAALAKLWLAERLYAERRQPR